MNPNNENPDKGTQVPTTGMEKRGVIDDATPFPGEQDDLDTVEKTAGAGLVTPRRPA